MSRGEVRVEAPDDWLGIPERFPVDRWTDVGDWARDAIEEYVEDLGAPDDEQREAALAMIARLAEYAAQVGARAYVLLESWTGPHASALLRLFPESDLEGRSLDEVAHERAEAVEAPIVEEFVTRGGFRGWNTTRYFQMPESGAVVVRFDVLVAIPGGFAGLTSSTGDLVAMQRARPALEALAASILPG